MFIGLRCLVFVVCCCLFVCGYLCFVVSCWPYDVRCLALAGCCVLVADIACCLLLFVR